MHTTTILNRLFVCEACSEVILFESDKEEHVRVTGHSRFIINDLTDTETDRMEYGDEQ